MGYFVLLCEIRNQNSPIAKAIEHRLFVNYLIVQAEIFREII